MTKSLVFLIVHTGPRRQAREASKLSSHIFLLNFIWFGSVVIHEKPISDDRNIITRSLATQASAYNISNKRWRVLLEKLVQCTDRNRLQDVVAKFASGFVHSQWMLGYCWVL